jgi:DNA-directed RNA polymerase subunit RPC12/RpoP
MMMKKLDKKTSEYTIDMTAIKEDGSFECPKCGKPISPEEPESEDTYQILNTKVVDGFAVLVFSCAKCKSTLKLPGIPTDIEV